MKNGAKKAAYTSPKLEVFGSVRNLTGGSGNMNMDGNVTMVLLNQNN